MTPAIALRDYTLGILAYAGVILLLAWIWAWFDLKRGPRK